MMEGRNRTNSLGNFSRTEHQEQMEVQAELSSLVVKVVFPSFRNDGEET